MIESMLKGYIAKSYQAFRPLLFKLDAETAHLLIASTAGRFCHSRVVADFFRRRFLGDIDSLRVVFAGKNEGEDFQIKLDHPLGMAAGFDKSGEYFGLLHALGFSFAEIGSVSCAPSQGNPRPRLFRLPDDQALINRMGLNNDGAEVIRARLMKQLLRSSPEPSRREQAGLKIGVNIVKTHDPQIIGSRAVADITGAYRSLCELGLFSVLNVSCPNTAEGKTFEEEGAFRELLSAVREARSASVKPKPLLIKFSPDLAEAELARLVEISESFGVAGYVLSNTTSQRGHLKTTAAILDLIGRGGLSGRPLFQQTLGRIHFVRHVLGVKGPIIAVGGIFSAEDAFLALKAGATLLEIYTALVYRGPTIVSEICQGLVQLLKRDGLVSIEDLRTG